MSIQGKDADHADSRERGADCSFARRARLATTALIALRLHAQSDDVSAHESCCELREGQVELRLEVIRARPQRPRHPRSESEPQLPQQRKWLAAQSADTFFAQNTKDWNIWRTKHHVLGDEPAAPATAIR